VSYTKGDGKMSTRQITVRINRTEAEFIAQKAKELGVTMSDVIRQAVAEYKDEQCRELKELVHRLGMMKLLEEVGKHE